jgi:hypothetical protein
MSFATTPQFQTSAGGVTLDPRILDVLQTAAQTYPMKVEAFSGIEGRTAGTTNHPTGTAVDVRLYDSSGTPLANSLEDAQRKGQNLADNFRAYEAYAQTARDIQTQKYPELNNVFRWGGYWNSGVEPFDLMHFDVNPAMKGAMGGGTWEDGLNADSRKMLKGVESVGMNDHITQQLADLGFKGPNAVADYQRARGLNPDGIIGPETTKRVALDVTPPARIPNPYGMKDVVDAIQKGDPTAVSTALGGAMKQIMDAHNAGTPDAQIAKDFNGYLGMLSPAEQANLRANFYASPEMQGGVKGNADKFGFFASGKLQEAVNAAFQHSQDIADSLMAGKPVGTATQGEIDSAMSRMAAVNPGKMMAGATSGYASPIADLPRLRPGDAASLIAKAGPAPTQAPDPMDGSSGKGVWQPGGAMPQTYAEGLPNPMQHLRPGEAGGAGGGQPIDFSSIATALKSLIPGMPGLPPGFQTSPGAAQGPAQAPAQGTPATGAFAGLVPRVSPGAPPSPFAGLQPRPSPGGPPATGAFAGLVPRIAPTAGNADPMDGSSGNGIWQPGGQMPQTYAEGLPNPMNHLRPGDLAPSAGALVDGSFPPRWNNTPQQQAAADAYNKAIAGTGTALWRNPGLAMSIPAVRELATGGAAVPRIGGASTAVADNGGGADDMGSNGTLWQPGGAMPMTYAEGLPNPMDHLRPGDLTAVASGGGAPAPVPRIIEMGQAPQQQDDSGGGNDSGGNYDTSVHGMGAVEDWFIGG